jgi:hypothetical protein
MTVGSVCLVLAGSWLSVCCLVSAGRRAILGALHSVNFILSSAALFPQHFSALFVLHSPLPVLVLSIVK